MAPHAETFPKNRPLFSRGHLGLWLLLGLSLSCQPEKDSCLSSADCKTPALPVCFQRRCQAALCQSDTDCQDPEKPSCKNGLCLPNQASCQTDLDCKDLQRPHCAQGSCQPRPPECTQDGDCPSVRFFCQQGSCWLRPECSQDGDCQEPTPLCEKGRCQAVFCQANSDCRDSEKPSCEKGRCHAKEASCTTDSDCSDPRLPRCFQGQCHVAPCSTDGDCKDPSEPRCRAGVCGPLCQTDTDCTQAGRPWCGYGLCQPRLLECADDTDCPGTRPFCKNDTCHAAAFVCANNGDCKVPFLPLCLQGRCQARPAGACLRDADCTTPSMPRCRNGVCGPLCLQNADCTAPQASCQQGRCSHCAHDLDCPPPQLCAEHRCVDAVAATSCQQDSDCKAPNQVEAKCFQGRCLRLLRLGGHTPILSVSGWSAWPPYVESDDYEWKETPQGLVFVQRLVYQTHELHCEVQRWSAKGEFLWAKRVEWKAHGGREGIAPCQATLTAEGDLLWIVGAGDGQQHKNPGEPPLLGIPAIHLFRYDPQGRLLWRKEMRWGKRPSPSSVFSFGVEGGSWKERSSFALSSTRQGASFFLVKEGIGNEQGTVSGNYFDLGEQRLPDSLASTRPFLIKFDQAGRVLWVRVLPHPATDMRVGPDGSLYLLGTLHHGRWQEQSLPFLGATDLYVIPNRIIDHGGRGGGKDTM